MPECLELQRIPARITKEHGSLLPGLTLEANIWLDLKIQIADQVNFLFVMHQLPS